MNGTIDKAKMAGLAMLIIALCVQALFLTQSIVLELAQTLTDGFSLDRELVSDVMLKSYWIVLPTAYLAGVVGSWFIKRPSAVVVAHGMVALMFLKQLALLVYTSLQ